MVPSELAWFRERMNEQRGPFESDWFQIVELVLVGIGVALLIASGSLRNVEIFDRTECVAGNFAEYDPDETGRMTVICPAVEGPAGAEPITIFTSRENPGETYTNRVHTLLLILAGIALVGAVALPAGCWLDWHRKCRRGDVVVVPPHPPAWRSDPTARHLYRFWTGTAWADYVSEGGRPTLDPM